jgi:hypothetical protein
MAALIVVALLSLFTMGVVGAMATVWTVRAEHADRALREDLDQTLAAILEGAAPRSSKSPAPRPDQ